MYNISEYIKIDEIKILLKEINMPIDVSNIIIDNIQTLDVKSIEPYFSGLFSFETGLESSKSIARHFGCEQDGIKELSVYIIAALCSKSMYIKKGINHTIFIDTFKIFTRFVNEHLETFGKYGFDRGWWTFRVLALLLFRVNQLEFEMKKLEHDNVDFGSPDDLTISVHIPSDAILTREMLEQSYLSAKDFFADYFTNYKYKYFYCNSWLLAPNLKQQLSPKSKILNFMADYDIKKVDLENESYILWVFKSRIQDKKDFPEDTSLQRSIKAYVLNGGKIGSGFGVLFDKA